MEQWQIVNRTCPKGLEGEDFLSSLASSAYPLSNPPPGFSLLGDRGVVAGTCSDVGWNYVFSFSEDDRASGWDKKAAESHRTPGVAADLCGYGYEKYFDGNNNSHIMMDIGANMGLSLMPYHAKGWRVVAFEPIPSNIAAIRRNIFINGISDRKIALIQGAATNSSGTLKLFAPRGRTDNTAASRSGSTKKLHGKDVDVYEVPAIQIDRYIDNALSPYFRNNISFVKIDTQGHELSVLQGMENFLSNPPTIEMLGGWSFLVVAEYSPSLQKASGHDERTMLDYMRNLGYEVRCNVDDEKPIVPPEIPLCPDVIFSRGKPTKPRKQHIPKTSAGS